MSPAPRAERDDPRGLGNALEFLRSLWKLNHALESASRTMRKRLGVTGPERLFIRMVGHHPGITPGALADILHVDRSTVTPLIKRLERRHLVMRAPSPFDARSFHLKLTRAGGHIDAMRSGTIEAMVQEAIAESRADDVQTAAAILTKIAGKLTGAAARGRETPPARSAGRRRARGGVARRARP